MIAKILNGRALAQKILEDLAIKIKTRQEAGERAPGLAVIQVGDNPASSIYVKNKCEACSRVGIRSLRYNLPLSISSHELKILIRELNQNPEVDGILLQLPLPGHLELEASEILDEISFEKDVDGFHPHNLGLLMQKRPLIRPCTPKGIMVLLQNYIGDLTGLHAVVIGASNIVGRPLSMELLLQGCTVTICHSRTRNIKTLSQQADILIIAVGQAGLVKADWIKPGAIVVDVGINRLDNRKIMGDVDFDSVSQKAAWISPVPGGVGPMTVAMLLENTLEMAEKFKK